MWGTIKKGVKYVNGKRRTRVNVGLIFNEGSRITKRDIKKERDLMIIFFYTSVFNTNDGL